MNKKLGIISLALVGGVSFSFGALAMETASAETAWETAKISMIRGASVRYYEDFNGEASAKDGGIRFSSVIAKEDYEALEALEVNHVTVSYGMLIAPYTYFGESDKGEFNETTVFGVNGEKKYTWEGDEDTKEGVTYTEIAHVTYDDLILSETEGYAGAYYELKGSLLNIKPENLTKEFVGRGYIKYTAEDGAVSYKFADYYENFVENNVRSIVYVSQIAIEKNDPAKDWVQTQYVSKVETEKTSYTLETYVGDELVDSQVVEEDVTVNKAIETTAVEYAGFEFDEEKSKVAGTAYANGKLTLKHVYNEDKAYQVTNGDFETGDLTGWTLTGDIGAVSKATHYWTNENGGYAFGLDGENMFSCYAVSEGDEKTGTLVSESFTVGGSGWLTFKLGGMKRTPLTYVEIVDAETNEILKRYGNSNFTEENSRGCALNAYKANLSDLQGKTVYIRVCDYAKSDYGVVFLDSFDSLYFKEPQEGFAVAQEVGFSKNEYELYNGDFSNGLDGWYEMGRIGVINEETRYWTNNENYEYNNVGKFFSAYESVGNEGAGYEGNKGTLVSSVFKIGGSGWITYAIGGMKNPDQVYMEVIDALTGEKYGHFYNTNMFHCSLIQYKADLSDFIGKLVYINFVDNATGDYGLIFCDSIKTYYEAEPTGDYIVAVNCVYNVMNGGFETGNLSGWTVVSGEVPGIVNKSDTYWFWDNGGISFNKSGTFLFHALEDPQGTNNECKKGTLRSSTFILKENGYISFKLGGATTNQNVYFSLVKENGEEIARFRNTNTTGNNGQLVQYVYAVNNSETMRCYVEIVDNAENEWGLICLDDVIVHQSNPSIEGAIQATNLK